MGFSVGIQSAGVSHCRVSGPNVLGCRGCHIVIGFGGATERECESKIDVVVNSVEPHPHEFGCKKSYKLCMDLDLWRPAFVVAGIDR
ncbi:hypothetical protein HETIRDRAFT_416800 [Heterobasidion irregulare TC 32-1]|uniref:Uncharacterized protein n=1 Tax=Heterobasidion irregulare (strain TC 32-1) TaxID=747525 RepID=W4KCB8_HETIT|nr:uncharacterized protein HETIRDRAFT_416800 [Heterobasidion irregulare TC 32-1]ETW82721.1 hypothetical protein HETIRDRAFT_416800 [Heterobasidion irregulare TC 32-1]